jgi:hypothetical protein
MSGAVVREVTAEFTMGLVVVFGDEVILLASLLLS